MLQRAIFADRCHCFRTLKFLYNCLFSLTRLYVLCIIKENGGWLESVEVVVVTPLDRTHTCNLGIWLLLLAYCVWLDIISLFPKSFRHVSRCQTEILMIVVWSRNQTLLKFRVGCSLLCTAELALRILLVSAYKTLWLWNFDLRRLMLNLTVCSFWLVVSRSWWILNFRFPSFLNSKVASSHTETCFVIVSAWSKWVSRYWSDKSLTLARNHSWRNSIFCYFISLLNIIRARTNVVYNWVTFALNKAVVINVFRAWGFCLAQTSACATSEVYFSNWAFSLVISLFWWVKSRSYNKFSCLTFMQTLMNFVRNRCGFDKSICTFRGVLSRTRWLWHLLGSPHTNRNLTSILSKLLRILVVRTNTRIVVHCVINSARAVLEIYCHRIDFSLLNALFRTVVSRTRNWITLDRSFNTKRSTILVIS